MNAGEMMIGPSRALFMDEISNDSIRQSIHILQGTTLISLLQPAPENYDLFRRHYSPLGWTGPRENVLEFFESMGFKCMSYRLFMIGDIMKTSEAALGSIAGMSHTVCPCQGICRGSPTIPDEISTDFDKSKNPQAALTTKKYGEMKNQGITEGRLELLKGVSGAFRPGVPIA
ncbi:hypothetical protein Sjap_019120 [Stephania japonica]|uniref:Uncharacterized protein n=1 Tax=Stephania japonica TaxID=461633 RepID=A0AAP0HZ19_9MAGN